MMYGRQVEFLGQDLRYVLRSFARTPGFVIITLLTLMLGIGIPLSFLTLPLWYYALATI